MKMRKARRTKCNRAAAHITWNKQLCRVLTGAMTRFIDEWMCRMLYRIYKPYFDTFKAFLDVLNEVRQQAIEMKEHP